MLNMLNAKSPHRGAVGASPPTTPTPGSLGVLVCFIFFILFFCFCSYISHTPYAPRPHNKANLLMLIYIPPSKAKRYSQDSQGLLLVPVLIASATSTAVSVEIFPTPWVHG